MLSIYAEATVFRGCEAASALTAHFFTNRAKNRWSGLAKMWSPTIPMVNLDQSYTGISIVRVCRLAMLSYVGEKPLLFYVPERGASWGSSYFVVVFARDVQIHIYPFSLSLSRWSKSLQKMQSWLTTFIYLGFIAVKVKMIHVNWQ